MKIVRTHAYLKALRKMGASAADQQVLEHAIAATPTVGVVIPGLGGVRKVRFGLSGRGKRGGGRAIYYLVLSEDTVLMIFAYAKADREDLTTEQKRQIVLLMKELKDG